MAAAYTWPPAVPSADEASERHVIGKSAADFRICVITSRVAA